jgi:RNA polymerase sigma-70 factor (ECF subfamily)
MGVDEQEDRDLLRSTDAADFGRFYQRHVGTVVSFLGSRVQGPEIVFDLTSEAFARALERRRQYDPARGPAVAWLLGITRNLLIDSVRRSRVAVDSRVRLGMAPIELEDEQLERVEARSRVDLRALLATLTVEQREAVVRRFLLDEPYNEIATSLSCSEQVVRKRVSRGLDSLRQAIEEHP